MRSLWLLGVVALVAALAACEGCRAPSTHAPSSVDAGATPAVRLYFVSDLAGALEPCGCVKDQLGGLGHFAALVGRGRPTAEAQGVLAVGPTFFMDMELTADRKAQEIAKAETLAASLKSLDLVAFAPGRNDWAAGPQELAKLTGASGAPLLAANLIPATSAARGWMTRDLGGLKLGIIGVAAPDKAERAPGPLDGVSSSPAADAVKAGVTTLRGEGAQVIIALAAVGRGEAKRIADANPELLAVVVGSAGGSGEGNTQAPPAERVGDVLIIETGNHLQTVSVLELHVRDAKDAKNAKKGALLAMADGTGIERIRKREELTRRIDELRTKISLWDSDTKIDKKDVDARKADVAKLEAERDALDKAPPPAAGSFYRYAMHEVRDTLGDDEAVHGHMLAYYKKVDDENKALFRDRVPKKAAKGEASFIGVDMCENCHEEAKAVWDKTRHAQAYKTLADQFKEFNLDCVSCHVTGYDRPGGSTVTHVASLENVQCEVCHGPGSLHAQKAGKVPMPVSKPGPDTCLSCHHPPHVHAFDAKAKMPEILGPGHGKPK